MKQDTIKASRFLYTARFYDYSRIKNKHTLFYIMWSSMRMVEIRRIELLTSCMPCKRSPS